MKVLRGTRLLEALEYLDRQLDEDSSYDQLYTGTVRGFPNTRKRQNATGPVSIVKIEYIPYTDSNTLRVDTVALSGGNKYSPILQFRDVTFEEEDSPTVATFTAVDGNDYHVQPVSLTNTNVKVRCDCLDFYWRFATWNHGDNSLVGDPPPPYVPKTDRPPVNPTQTPGMCKHIIKVAQRLRQGGLVR